MIDYQYFAGGLTDTPQIRYTPNGAAVTTFTLAQSDNKKNDAGEWETTNNLYLRVSVWDNDRHTYSDTLAALNKGDKLVVHGKLITHKWQDKEGNTRSQIEMQARDVYTHATTNGATAPAPQQAPTWGGPQGGFGQQDPWGSAPQQQQPNNENPPF